ncbi:hypothetical protein HKX48_005729 [Thoreauomyces humboldtii]|nr:hypothetical protein HKX48_005729 [Thoreauomyces humboldtii]
MVATQEKPIAIASLPFKVPDILDDVFSLYTAPNSATQKPVFQARFNDDAVFEDPLLRVETKQDREAQFGSLPAVFQKIEISRKQGDFKVFAVTPNDIAQDGIPEKYRTKTLVRIVAPNTQTYTFPRVPIVGYAPQVAIPGVTRLTVEKATGRIVKHQDVWNLTGEHLPGVLPVVGSPAAYFYTFAKHPLGYVSSQGLKVLDYVGLIKG